MLIRRRVAFGTTRQVEVMSVEVLGGFEVIACADLTRSVNREGYVLCPTAGEASPCEPGDRGVITFERGGPNGNGRWVLSDLQERGQT